MKKIISVSCLLLSAAILGCAQHATAPTVARPDSTASSDTNMFGDSKAQAGGDAEHARNENYSAQPAQHQANADTSAPK